MQKGPYFNNVQYISPLPEGYLAASSNIANTYGNMFQNLGSQIGKGLETYYKNEEERSTLGGVIAQYVKSDPSVIEGIDPKLVQKFQEGKATLKDNRDIFSSIGTSVMLRDKKQKEDMAKQQSEVLAAQLQSAQNQLGEFERLKSERAAFTGAIGRNTVADTGEVDWQGVSRDLAASGLNPYSDELKRTRENQRAVSFAGPSATPVNDDKGNPIAYAVQTAPDQSTVVSAPRAEPRKPMSNLGQTWDDYYNARTPEEAASYLREIEGSAKKAAAELNGKPLTDSQASALNFSLRMRMNNGVLEGIEYNPANFLNGSFTPFERLKTDERKKYETAKRNWVSANLRKESGAAIGPKEYEEADIQYFPQPGDGESVIAQKNALRKQAELGMTAGIGPNAEELIAQYTYTPPKKATNGAAPAEDAAPQYEFVNGKLVKKSK